MTKDYSIARRRMVEQQITSRGITDQRVIDAMLSVPRHLFVESGLQDQAYSDFPLPIGHKQTISQPYIVAYMTEALNLTGHERVLEIGTGSGYQAAILSKTARQVYTVERVADLARKARKALDLCGAYNVHIRVNDGTCGWEDQGPFDAIITTAGSPSVPETLKMQLEVGGRLLIPVGTLGQQVLCLITRKSSDRYTEERLIDCRFVPLIGRFGWQNEAGESCDS
jgi:protein-L-isoaspartate(D-aspartate) O-methyltransferase